MKVTCKTVQGKAFQIEANAEDKVLDVKGKISELQGFPAENQKLIHKGKVLADDTTLDSNGVSEASFIVVMVMAAKAKPAAPTTTAPAATAAPAEPAPPAPQPVPVPEAAPAAAEASAAAAAPAAGEDPAPAGGADELLVGPALEERISMICEMGFAREEVVRAMRAAYNNSERAVEYLMNGIPAHAEPVAGAPAGGAAAAGGAPALGAPSGAAAGGPGPQPLDMFGGGGGAARGGAGLGDGSLDFLRNNPQFHALRNMVQNNPQILQPMLQELAKSNPQLLQMINSNQDEFMRLLSEAAGPGGEGLGDLAAGMDMEGGFPPGVVQIQLTPEEAEAVTRLEALGFPRELCLEAFLACDKNEEMAANYLFENGADDMQ